MSFLARLFGLSDPLGLKPADFVVEADPSAPVIDVRTPGEFSGGHLKRAMNLNVADPDFTSRIEKLQSSGKLDKSRPVYLYCRSGARSARATRMLRGMGYEQAWNIGGFGALRRAGADVVG